MDILSEIRRLFKEPDVEYISLKYCDDYNSLNQSIVISKLEFIETNETVLSYMLLCINPNLRILKSITIYTYEQFPIKTIYYDDKGNIIGEFNDKIKGGMKNEIK